MKRRPRAPSLPSPQPSACYLGSGPRVRYGANSYGEDWSKGFLFRDRWEWNLQLQSGVAKLTRQKGAGLLALGGVVFSPLTI